MPEKTKKQQPKSQEQIDAATHALLQKLSIGASGIATIGAPFVKGPMGRIAGDTMYYGSQKEPIGMAFHPEMPRDDRMNGLLSALGVVATDQISDAGMAGILALLASRGIKVNPIAANAAFQLKNLGLSPINNAINEKVFETNAGRRAANAVKKVDNEVNYGNLQNQYSELLPLLEQLAQQPGAYDNVTNPIGYVNEKQLSPRKAISKIGRSMLPENVQPAVDNFAGNVNRAAANTARSVAGLGRDVNTVLKGVKPYADVFAQQFGRALQNSLNDGR
jgi:hypothetical protein